MRRALLLVATMMLTVMVAAGVALAATINCGSASQDPLTPQCYGTDQGDQIEGTDARDIIYAKGGADSGDANAGNDAFYGSLGKDSFSGVEGNDKLYGGGNADFLMDTSPDIDTDELRGGAANDILDANDFDGSDTLVCGPGEDDRAYYDFDPISLEIDTVSDSCENKLANTHPK